MLPKALPAASEDAEEIAEPSRYKAECEGILKK